MPDLVIHNLIERTAFVEESVKFDDVRILCRESDNLARRNEMGGEADRSTVFVGGPVETKNNHSGLAYGRVGRHSSCGQKKRRSLPNL